MPDSACIVPILHKVLRARRDVEIPEPRKYRRTDHLAIMISYYISAQTQVISIGLEP